MEGEINIVVTYGEKQYNSRILVSKEQSRAMGLNGFFMVFDKATDDLKAAMRNGN
jgi:hypothetical protein